MRFKVTERIVWSFCDVRALMGSLGPSVGKYKKKQDLPEEVELDPTEYQWEDVTPVPYEKLFKRDEE